MEREIKFRGKRVDKEEFAFGDLLTGMGYKKGKFFILPHLSYYPSDCKSVDGYEVIPETIGQYTGLKDKNGKEIYEGDIVLTPFVDPIFGDMVGEDLCVKRQVKFNDSSFVVDDGNGFIYLECFTRNNHIEIYGNIHDNPELLKDVRD